MVLAGLGAVRAHSHAPLAGDGPGRLDSVRQALRDEDRSRRLVLDAGSCLREQRVRRLPACGGDEQVAVDARPAQDDPPHASLPSARLDPPERQVTQVDNAGDHDARVAQVVDDVELALVGREHDCALARLDRVVANEPPDRLGEHDADEVVPGEDERLLDRAGSHHDPLGAVAVEDGAAVDRNEPALPDPECAGRGEHLDAV